MRKLSFLCLSLGLSKAKQMISCLSSGKRAWGRIWAIGALSSKEDRVPSYLFFHRQYRPRFNFNTRQLLLPGQGREAISSISSTFISGVKRLPFTSPVTPSPLFFFKAGAHRLSPRGFALTSPFLSGFVLIQGLS